VFSFAQVGRLSYVFSLLPPQFTPRDSLLGFFVNEDGESG